MRGQSHKPLGALAWSITLRNTKKHVILRLLSLHKLLVSHSNLKLQPNLQYSWQGITMRNWHTECKNFDPPLAKGEEHRFSNLPENMSLYVAHMPSKPATSILADT